LFAGAEFHEGGEGTIEITNLSANIVPEPAAIAIWTLLGLAGAALTIWRGRGR
jgi:hypothetical protein